MERPLTVYGDNMPPIEQLFPSDLAADLSSFIFEVCNSEEFPPLFTTLSEIQQHILMNVNSPIDFFKDSEFTDFPRFRDRGSEALGISQKLGRLSY